VDRLWKVFPPPKPACCDKHCLAGVKPDEWKGSAQSPPQHIKLYLARASNPGRRERWWDDLSRPKKVHQFKGMQVFLYTSTSQCRHSVPISESLLLPVCPPLPIRDHPISLRSQHPCRLSTSRRPRTSPHCSSSAQTFQLFLLQ